MQWRFAFVLTVAVQMAACHDVVGGQASEGLQKLPSVERRSVCLHRLLLDLPTPIEIGASGAIYKDGFGIDGINDFGARGPRWGGLKLVETFPADAKGFEALRGGVEGELTGTLYGSRAGIESADERIRSFKQRLKTANSEERKSYEEMIEQFQLSLSRSQRSLKVSGWAKLHERDAFALRRADEYSVGYLDAVDQRIRLFEGSLQDSKPETPEPAAKAFRDIQSIYHRRAPTDIPAAPGYCTGYGFLDEPAGKLDAEAELHLPFRSLKYPNLVFILTVKPADPNGPRNMKQLDNPNVLTAKDVREMKGMGAAGALLSLGNIKNTYGPKSAQMAGQEGRVFGREYHHKGHMDGRGGGVGAAYELEAEVLGEPGRIDRPAIKLQMAAALPDADKRAPDVEEHRPALKGHQPPPFDEGLKIFEEVLRSVRMRPTESGPAR